MSLVQIASDEHRFKFNAVTFSDDNDCHENEEKGNKTPESSPSAVFPSPATPTKPRKSEKVLVKAHHHAAQDTLTLNGLVSPPVFSPRLLSPDSTVKHVRFMPPAEDEHNLIRLVSQRECWILKNNILTVLKENNFTVQYQFNQSEFVEMFQMIFPSSSKEEITKLFNLLTSTNTNLLSFDLVINNDENFQLLLESMGCRMISDDENDPMNIPQDMDTNDMYNGHSKRSSLYLEPMDKTRRSRNHSLDITPRYSPMARDFDPSKPMLSWKQGNTNEYLEYIEYQREIIETLRTQINDTYKPLLLQNKQTVLSLQTVQTENETLRQENETLSNEISDLEERLQAIKEEEDEQKEEKLLRASLHRNISDSFAEIQQSHEFLHSEVKELNDRIQLTRKLSNQTTMENLQLNAANDKYAKLTQQLNDNLKRLRTELNEAKSTIHSKTEEINQLKVELFEKDQFNQELHKQCNDLTQQIQFHQAKNPKSSRRISKDFDLRVTSVRSTTRRTNSIYVEFDIFTELLSSPRKQTEGYSQATTPKCQSWNDTKWRSMSRDLPMNLTDDLVEDAKDELIASLRTDLSELQKKYDRDMVHLQTSMRNELEKQIRSEVREEMMQQMSQLQAMKNPQKLEKATVHSNYQQNENQHHTKGIRRGKYKKSMATQTAQSRQLGFWERFFSEIKCLPIDERCEW